MRENSQRIFKRLLIILLAVMLLTGSMIVLAFQWFYSIAANSIIRRWENSVQQSARDVSYYLTTPMDAIAVPELKDRKICISLGASFYPANRNDSFEDLYKRADKGTYESKKTEGSHATFRYYDTDAGQ